MSSPQQLPAGAGNIFEMAQKIAEGIPQSEKDELQNMDMQNMIGHVTKNVMGMMQNMNLPEDLLKGMGPLSAAAGPTDSGKTAKPAEVRNKKSKISLTPPKIEECEDDDEEEDTFQPKTKDIHFNLNVTLEELYSGKKKKLSVKRTRIVKAGGKDTLKEEKKKIVIPIEGGMRDEQSIRFHKEADEYPGKEPGDIVITVCEGEHDTFERDGDNLFMVKNISLSEAYDYSFYFKHLNGKLYKATKSEGDVLHTRDGIRKISNMGMPIYKSDNEYGDLYIRFHLSLPSELENKTLQSNES